MTLADLPPALRRYILAIGLGGPLVVLLAVTVTVLSDVSPVWVLLLTALAAIGERFPLHLTHKTNIHVATVSYVALIMTVPPALAGALALQAVCLAMLHRWLTNPDGIDFPEAIFNLGQTTLYVFLGGIAYTITPTLPLVPGDAHAGPNDMLKLVAGTVVLHLSNTGLVAIAGALQIGAPPLRVWRNTLGLDLAPTLTLAALGAVIAVNAQDRPIVLLVLVLPLVLVQHTVWQTIRLRDDTHRALTSLVEVVELRDPYTAGHSYRVATTAGLLAGRAGLTAEEADLIESAGRVHDVGKVALDPRLLQKPGKLSPSEWDQMRLHPVIGANVISRFSTYGAGVPLVRHHHEAWDGSGYPDGLKGEAIPLGARILAVADTFDALTSDRPYRDGLSVDAALRILENGAGRQWDPRIVDALGAVVRESPADIPLAAAATRPDPIDRAGGNLHDVELVPVELLADEAATRAASPFSSAR